MTFTIKFLYEDRELVRDFDYTALNEDEIKSILKLQVHDTILLGSGSTKQNYRVLKIDHRFVSADLSGKPEDNMVHVYIVEAI